MKLLDRWNAREICGAWEIVCGSRHIGPFREPTHADAVAGLMNAFAAQEANRCPVCGADRPA